MKSWQWMVRFASIWGIAGALIAGGCGGGGGGGSGDGGLSVSPSHLEFSGVASDTTEPPAQTFTISVSGSGEAYLDLEYSGVAYEAEPLVIDGNTATGKVRVPAPVHEGAGRHTGSVTVNAYAYGFGGEHIPGSPKEVEVTYTIPGIVASDIAVFNQTSASLPSPTTITLSDAEGNSYGWTSELEYVQVGGEEEFSDWVQVTPASGGSLPADITVAVIEQGNLSEHQAYVVITSTTNPNLKARIPVIYRPYF